MEGLTAKKVYDNFRDFTDHEKFGIYDSNGKNLHDRIRELVELHLEDPKKYPLGMKVYGKLKAEFRGSTSPQKQLEKVQVAETDEVQPALLKAAIAFKKSKNHAVFNGVLHTLEAISKKDFVGICQYGLSLKPRASPHQMRLGLDLLRFSKRLGIFKVIAAQAARGLFRQPLLRP